MGDPKITSASQSQKKKNYYNNNKKNLAELHFVNDRALVANRVKSPCKLTVSCFEALPKLISPVRLSVQIKSTNELTLTLTSFNMATKVILANTFRIL